MKRLLYSLVTAVVLIASLSYAPPAQAARDYAVSTDYYDSNLVNVGTSYLGCTGPQQNWGTLAGEWKELEIHRCVDDEITTEVYHYCSGVWVQVGYLGDTSC